jgi:pantothenate kinase-related protein Tda10
MSRKYRNLVLAYYKSEWTDFGDGDNKRLIVTAELDAVIMDCWKVGMNVPTAAHQVQIFLSMEIDKRRK